MAWFDPADWIRGLPLLIFFIAGPYLCLDAAEASLEPSTPDD